MKQRMPSQFIITIVICSLSWVLVTIASNQALQLFLPWLAEKHGGAYTDLLYFTTVGGIISCFCMVLAGYIAEKDGGVKAMFVWGSIAAGAAYLLFPVVPNLTLVKLLVAVTAIVVVFYNVSTTMILATNWFPRKKGVILGIITAFSGCSGIFLVPAFNKAAAAFGYPVAIYAVGIALIAFGIFCQICLKETPAECGYMPDNMPMTPEEEARILIKAGNTCDWSAKQILTNPIFMLAALGGGIWAIGAVGIGNTAVAVLTGNGMTMDLAVQLLSYSGIAAIVGSVFSGYLEQWVGIRISYPLWGVLQGAACFMMGFGSMPIMIAGFLLFMFLSGGVNNYLPSIIVTLSGPKNFSGVYKFTNAIVFLLRAFGASVVAIAIAVTGTSLGALVVAAFCCFIAAIMGVATGCKYQPTPAERAQTK